jgi:hypothetical protein
MVAMDGRPCREETALIGLCVVAGGERVIKELQHGVVVGYWLRKAPATGIELFLCHHGYRQARSPLQARFWSWGIG